MACVCRVVLQTDGATPLLIASQSGHLECVRALLDGGAAINQAMVGCASLMGRHCGGYSRGDPWEPCRACMCSWWGGCPPRGGELSQEVIQPMFHLTG